MTPKAIPGPKFRRKVVEYLPSAFNGIVRLTNFSSLRSENLSLTNK
jgi:hypothetical protein